MDMENNIIKQLKNDISIYQFNKEQENNSQKSISKTIKRTIITIISIITASSTVIFAYNYNNKIEMEEIDISEYITLDSVKDAIKNGYIENVDMEYQYSNGIGCKINSLVISDNVINVVIDFDFGDKTIDNKIYSKVIIYDENKNVYCNFTPLSTKPKDYKYQKAFYKKVGLSYKKELNTSIGYQQLQATKNRVQSMLSIEAISPIPVSEKMYINIYDIGYADVKADKYEYLFQNIDWNFSIDMPKIFKNRTNTEFELSKNIEGFKIEELYVTDTLTTLTYEIDDNLWIDNIEIIDEQGKKYSFYLRTRIGEDKGRAKYTCQFQLNKNMITSKMFIQIGNANEVIELRQK